MGICSENRLIIVKLGLLFDDQVPVFLVDDLKLIGYENGFLKAKSQRCIHEEYFLFTGWECVKSN